MNSSETWKEKEYIVTLTVMCSGSLGRYTVCLTKVGKLNVSDGILKYKDMVIMKLSTFPWQDAFQI